LTPCHWKALRKNCANVLEPKNGTLVHSPGGAVGPVLDLVQIDLRRALPEIVLRVIEHIDRRLPHVAGALGLMAISDNVRDRQRGKKKIWMSALPPP
jgi:hypothetical protein